MSSDLISRVASNRSTRLLGGLGLPVVQFRGRISELKVARSARSSGLLLFTTEELGDPGSGKYILHPK